MSDSTRSYLKKRLVTHYTAFVKKLERYYGSAERATDAVHDVWLRLDAMPEIGPIANADAYLSSMLSNVTVDQFRSERRHMHEEEIDEFFQVEDELADPERIVAARMEVDALKAVLDQLPARRRAILLAARIEGKLNREIADELGVSVRLVEKELSLGLRHCADCLLDVKKQFKGVSRGRRKF
jgi:RNA polymerase sigma factor (sigma-70 family)